MPKNFSAAPKPEDKRLWKLLDEHEKEQRDAREQAWEQEQEKKKQEQKGKRLWKLRGAAKGVMQVQTAEQQRAAEVRRRVQRKQDKLRQLEGQIKAFVAEEEKRESKRLVPEKDTDENMRENGRSRAPKGFLGLISAGEDLRLEEERMVHAFSMS